MNITSAISVTNHTHLEVMKEFYAEAYLFRSLINCSMERKEA